MLKRILYFSVQPQLARCILSMGYKSQYNIDNLYPKKDSDRTLSAASAFKKDTASAEFSGFIPLDKVEFRYSRSSGAGGQHVNTTNSKVELRVHIDAAEWIPDHVKPVILKTEQNRINKDGFLIVTSQRTRKQILNQADCLDKLRSIVILSSKKPKEPTEEDTLLRQKRLENRRQEMLRQKKHHSLKKQSRQSSSCFD